VSGDREKAVDGFEEPVEVELSVAGGDERLSLIVRSLCAQDDYEQCEALERETWGQAIVVPASLLMVSQKVGGVTAGAFDSAGRLVGMVYGLTGPREGRLVHWSHMLAVREDLRGLGLGRELKLFQRRLVRRSGVERMLWTYDPLVARNAHLNINRLGARPVEYLEDLYGAESDSQLHHGLGTDRFVVEWPLGEESVVPMCDGVNWSGAPVVNTDHGEPAEAFELPHVAHVQVEIPFDIQEVKSSVPEAGFRWRACTRRALQGYFGRGLVVVGFRHEAGSDRCFYLLADPEVG